MSVPSQIGRFQVRAVLGSGAFGTVYRAYDPQLDREVALKVPRAGTLDSPQRLERFQREARSSARLRHPHIVPVFETGFDGVHHFIASAFVEGRTLAETLRAGPMPPRQAASLIRDLALALAHAHDNGIVHRDVKPANVLVDAQGQALLMDFGLAYRQDAQRLTRLGSFMGTPGYMAPEMAAGTTGECRPACDQYSLGVVLYELLCGQKPFEGPTEIVLFNVIQNTPPAPRALNSGVPADLEAICLKAMAKKPEERFAGCRELANALSQWLETHRDTPATAIAAGAAPATKLLSPATTQLPPPANRRIPVYAALGAGGFVALIIIATILLSPGRRADQTADAGQARKAKDSSTNQDDSSTKPAPQDPAPAAANKNDEKPAPSPPLTEKRPAKTVLPKEFVVPQFPSKKGSLHSKEERRIFREIERVRKLAERIKIDGKADDWAGIPAFSDPEGDARGDNSRDIVQVAIAPRADDLLVMIKTKAKPAKEDGSFWLNVDLMADSTDDFRVGVNHSGTHTLWVYPPGLPAEKTARDLRVSEFAVDEVFEMRLPYATLAKALPTDMVELLRSPNPRSWVRVSTFTLYPKTDTFVDHGPAVASFRLAATPYALDPPGPRPGKAAHAIEVPVKGDWLVQHVFPNLWAYNLSRVNASLQHSTRPEAEAVRNLESRRNEDFFSWNQPVFAPMDGRVISVRRDSPDIPPHDPSRAMGTLSNDVFLDVGNNLGLLLVQFQQGSVRVDTGQIVKAGRELGLVGNSGNTYWPHLHMAICRVNEADSWMPLAFADVRVSLNLDANDPWARRLDWWDIREGFFVGRWKQ